MRSESYVRQATVPDIGVQGVDELRGSTVVIVGCGGLGHPAAAYLATSGVGRIVLVDYDDVEASNLGRQILFQAADIGRAKVDCLAAALTRMSTDVEVVVIKGRLGSREVDLQVSAMLDRAVPVLDCTDNFEARHSVSSFCREFGHWHVWGNVFRWEGSVAVFDPSRGISYEDFFDDPPVELRATCASGGVVNASCGVIGSFMAAQALKLMIHKETKFLGSLLDFDVERGLVSKRSQPLVLKRGASSGPESSRDGEVSLCSPQDVLAMAEGPGVQIVDVREGWEIERLQVPFAEHVPMAGLWAWLQDRRSRGNLVFVCASGVRARQAVMIATRLGWPSDRVSALNGTASELVGAKR